MEVLVCLAEHTGEVVPKEKLLQAVWPDIFVSDDVLTRSVSELRRVFGDDAHASRIIETIPKRGYRLLVAVTPGNGLMVGPASLLKSCRAVLEELLLPAVEHRRLEPRLVTQIRDRHSFHQMPPENGGFFFRRVVLPLLFHVFAPLVS